MKLMGRDVEVGMMVLVCEPGMPDELLEITRVAERLWVESSGAFTYDGVAQYVDFLHLRWPDV